MRQATYGYYLVVIFVLLYTSRSQLDKITIVDWQLI